MPKWDKDPTLTSLGQVGQRPVIEGEGTQNKTNGALRKALCGVKELEPPSLV